VPVAGPTRDLNLTPAQKSLREVEGNIQLVLERRERMLKTSRDVILKCSRAIVFLHSGKTTEARAEIVEADRLLGEMRKDAKPGLSRYLTSPETEFVEASAMEAVVLKKTIPDHKKLGVSEEAYLLGLLDSVGELKRMILDAITAGKAKDAAEYFDLMERLYAMLSPFAVFDNVVNGVRRKIDVARMITEDTRGTLLEETRRQVVLDSIEKLQRKLQ
jgi:translin